MQEEQLGLFPPSRLSLRLPWEASYRVEANLMESPVTRTRQQGVLNNVAFFSWNALCIAEILYYSLFLSLLLSSPPTRAQIYRQEIGPGGNKLPKEHDVH